MAQYGVYRTAEGGLLLDCQTDLLEHLNTRLVVPLLPPDVAPQPAEFLNPRFVIQNAPCIMVTQFAASVPATELQTPVADLSAEHFIIQRALDMLLTGV